MTFQERVRQQYDSALAQASTAEVEFRRQAFEAFERLGLPDSSNEAWKYSNLNALSKPEWTAARKSAGVSRKVQELVSGLQENFFVILVANGSFQEAGTWPTGVSVKPRGFSAFPQLNYDDGLVSSSVAVNAGGFDLAIQGDVDKPLAVVHAQEGEGTWNSTLNLITLEKGARLALAEIFVADTKTYLRTDVTRVQVHEGASLDWVRVQRESDAASSFSEVQAHLGRAARLHVTQLNGGAAWSRTTLKVDVHGEGAEAFVNGLSFGRDRQHVDQRVQVSHHAPHGTSAQLFKGVFKDQARGVLNGKIYIARDAQKINSSQLNHNLLLGSGAEADTKPELEIYADDVKANHGASVGRLDEDRLFYLLSRGIRRAEAESMLAQAFVGDVLMKIPSPALRRFLQGRVAALVPGFLRGGLA